MAKKNPIVKVITGENKGMFKWISEDAIYYARKEAPLHRRRGDE